MHSFNAAKCIHDRQSPSHSHLLFPSNFWLDQYVYLSHLLKICLHVHRAETCSSLNVVMGLQKAPNRMSSTESRWTGASTSPLPRRSGREPLHFHIARVLPICQELSLPNSPERDRHPSATSSIFPSSPSHSSPLWSDPPIKTRSLRSWCFSEALTKFHNDVVVACICLPLSDETGTPNVGRAEASAS